MCTGVLCEPYCTCHMGGIVDLDHVYGVCGGTSLIVCVYVSNFLILIFISNC